MGAVAIVIAGLGGFALIGRGVRIVLRGEVPTVKATRRGWRNPTEAGVFRLLLGSALLIVACLWIGTATGVAGPNGVVGPDAGLLFNLVPLLPATLAVTRYRPRKVTDLGSHA